MYKRQLFSSSGNASAGSCFPFSLLSALSLSPTAKLSDSFLVESFWRETREEKKEDGKKLFFLSFFLSFFLILFLAQKHSLSSRERDSLHHVEIRGAKNERVRQRNDITIQPTPISEQKKNIVAEKFGNRFGDSLMK